jgi:multidrug resistance efflux pump
VEARFGDRLFVVAASVALLGVAATAVHFWRQRAAPQVKSEAARVPAAEETVLDEASFTGVIQARNSIPVAAPIDGTIEALEATEGDSVFEGQVLARIKNEGLLAAYEQAAQELEQIQSRIHNLESALITARLEASRALADSQRSQAEFEKIEKAAIRQQLLYNEGATARLTYEKAQKDRELSSSERTSLREAARQAEERVQFLTSDIDKAKKTVDERTQNLETAKTDLQAAEVQSPVDGLLVASKSKVGDQVQGEMQDLFVIAVAPEELAILIEPDPKIAGTIKDGAPALIQIPELSRDGIEGEVRRDEDGRILVEFEAGDATVKPGLHAIVKIRLR